MMLKDEPPFATAWPSLAEATAIVPKTTSNVVTTSNKRPLKLPRGSGWSTPLDERAVAT
jgi:hypothetical protein